jgi:hypothetical protein
MVAELMVVLGAAKPVVVHGIAELVVVFGAAVLKGFRIARRVLEIKAAVVMRSAYLVAVYVCLSDLASSNNRCFCI